MNKTGSPKRLWYHCLELKAYIRSCTVHDMYVLDGGTPEAMMEGKTVDISHISECGWYEWVMFRDTPAQFPDSKMVLDGYLWPSIDTGPVIMMTKIMIYNGHVVPHLTLQGLTLAKRESLEQAKIRHGN